MSNRLKVISSEEQLFHEFWHLKSSGESILFICHKLKLTTKQYIKFDARRITEIHKHHDEEYMAGCL